MEIKQDFSIDQLFIIKSALHLLANKTLKELLNGDVLADRDFDAIAELEKSFVTAYYSARGIN